MLAWSRRVVREGTSLGPDRQEIQRRRPPNQISPNAKQMKKKNPLFFPQIHPEHTHTHTHTIPYSLSLSLFLSHTHTHTIPYPLSLSRTHLHIQSPHLSPPLSL